MIRSVTNSEILSSSSRGAVETKDGEKSVGQEFSELISSFLSGEKRRQAPDSTADDSILASSFAQVETTRAIEPERARTQESDNTSEKGKEEGESSVEEEVTRSEAKLHQNRQEVENGQTASSSEASVEKEESVEPVTKESSSEEHLTKGDVIEKVETGEVKLAELAELAEVVEVVEAPEEPQQSEAGEEVELMMFHKSEEQFSGDEGSVLADARQELGEENAVVKKSSEKLDDSPVEAVEQESAVPRATQESEEQVVVDDSSKEKATPTGKNDSATGEQKSFKPFNEILPQTPTAQQTGADLRQAIRNALSGLASRSNATLGTSKVDGGPSGFGKDVVGNISLGKGREESRETTTRAGKLLESHASRTLERVEEALKKAAEAKDGKTVELRLDPPELGRVRVKVQLTNEGLHTKLTAESGDVTQLLREKAFELQGLLRSLGLNLDKVTVSVSSDSSSLSFSQGGDQSDNSAFEQFAENSREEVGGSLHEPHGMQTGRDKFQSTQLDHWVA